MSVAAVPTFSMAERDRRWDAARAFMPVEPDHPTMAGDMELKSGMTFALEPNYVFGRHLAYLGGTVIVGEDEGIELNPYTAQILRAQGTAASPAGVR